VTDTATSQAELIAGLEAAALLLAQTLGLGEETRRSDDWPIDEGDAVLVMPFGGDPASALVLAVNDDVAERLLADPASLDGAFAEATRVLNGIAPMELRPTTVSPAGVSRPPFIVEIFNEGNLTALAGMTLPTRDDSAAPGSAPAASVYQPAAIDPDPSGGSRSKGDPSSLTVLHDVEMVVTAELGRTTMPVRELLGLVPGMVVEIDRAAGSPIDVLVNGRKIAEGEVVVIDEEFGIRITEIVPTGEHAR
jgi:flagellar motor switch protein FliN/FliY